MFERLSRQNRYAILYRIATAKRADLRGLGGFSNS
jgi:uncharacterized protein YdeI (YjbR/CyaY-like superfamily)